MFVRHTETNIHEKIAQITFDAAHFINVSLFTKTSRH
jgi:hypothetical protein